MLCYGLDKSPPAQPFTHLHSLFKIRVLGYLLAYRQVTVHNLPQLDGMVGDVIDLLYIVLRFCSTSIRVAFPSK